MSKQVQVRRSAAQWRALFAAHDESRLPAAVFFVVNTRSGRSTSVCDGVSSADQSRGQVLSLDSTFSTRPSLDRNRARIKTQRERFRFTFLYFEK